MAEEGEIVFYCPSCNAALEIVDGEDSILCGVCRSEFPLTAHLCPKCGLFHEDEEGICAECGSALVQFCRNCQSINWPGFDVCIVCGEAMGLASTVVARSTETTADRLSKQMDRARQLKVKEEQSSNVRMAELMAIEEARQAEIKKRIKRQKEQERRLLLVMFSAVAIFLLILVVFALVSGFR